MNENKNEKKCQERLWENKIFESTNLKIYMHMYYASYDCYKQCNNSHLMPPKSFTLSIEAEHKK